METAINRHIEKAVFNYLPDVYLYYGLFRCLDIVKEEHPNVSEDNQWQLITEKYDLISSIVLKGIFQAEIDGYRPISEFEKYSILNSYNISGYYEYGFDLTLDLANYWSSNKNEISKLGFSIENFAKVCLLFSYRKIRERITEARNSSSFILHKFTLNDEDANLNIYLSLKAFMAENDLLEMFRSNQIKEYINKYLKDYYLEVIDKEKLTKIQIDSDIIVGLSDSIKYGIDTKDLSRTFSNPQILSGILWKYERKKPSFYTAQKPVASMIHPAMQNLYKCFQINLVNTTIKNTN